MQAMIMNRIGDVALCIGMFIMYRECGSLEYEVVFSVVGQGYVKEEYVTFIAICLLIGAVGKSAQIGLHT
jgi:NADH:ubiquinone oxidoreductase subunit 5 (subunit L)/multisubunit Na+/H+ antiporter MnhA subunit